MYPIPQGQDPPQGTTKATASTETRSSGTRCRGGSAGPAVNLVDASALESLETINERLKDAGVRLHLSEVKGPVMDRLKRSHFLEELSGNVYLNTYDAMEDLDLDCVQAAFSKDAATTSPDAIPCPSLTLAGLERV